MKPRIPILNRARLLGNLALLPYQSAFAANNSRFKIGLWARQTGKDHTATAEAVVDCLQNPGTTWIILAASERQALESLSKAKDWAEILKFRIDEYIEAPANLPLAIARSASTEIKWSNGSRLLALPANPQTIRGYSANLILTEFAFHENPDAIWRAIYPSISNPLRGGLKKIRIISTPNGLTNKFADLWLNTPNPNPNLNPNPSVATPRKSVALYLPSSPLAFSPEPLAFSPEPLAFPVGGARLLPSLPLPPLLDTKSSSFPSFPSVQKSAIYFKSKITIHDAINSGLPLNAAELQAGLNDPEAWSQEYLCEFMDSSSVMFPYDLIQPCESEQASESSSRQSGLNGELYAGIDFGRKHHLTVCWILQSVPNHNRNPHPNLLVTRDVVTLKNMSTPDQLEILKPILHRCRRICLDYTGAGVGLGDYLAKQFGEYANGGARLLPSLAKPGKVELCQFTTALKSELFPRLRTAFEQRLLRIPISREIREDLHAIQRTVTQSGQITYRAPHTADGHSDRTTALALALRAASSGPVSAPAQTIFVRGRSADLRWSRRSPWSSRRRFLF